MGTKFVTQIKLEDFVKIYPHALNPHYLDESNQKLYPLAVAIHDNYPSGGYFKKDIGYDSPLFIAENAKHIYSTRDYFEIETAKKPGFRYKVPKNETRGIYLVMGKED